MNKSWNLWGNRYVTVAFSYEHMLTLRFSIGWDRWYDFLFIEVTLLGFCLNSSNAIEF